MLFDWWPALPWPSAVPVSACAEFQLYFLSDLNGTMVQ